MALNTGYIWVYSPIRLKHCETYSTYWYVVKDKLASILISPQKINWTSTYAKENVHPENSCHVKSPETFVL